MRTLIIPSEDALQCAVVDQWQARPVPKSILAAIPNGGRRDKKVAARMKASGVLPGMPDLFALGNRQFARLRFNGPQMALIELKRPMVRSRNAEKYLSDPQQEIVPILRQGGVEVMVSNDLDEVLRFLEEMGVLRTSK